MCSPVADRLTKDHADALRREIDRAIAFLVTSTKEIPPCQDAIPAMIEIGCAIAALKTLKDHLP